MSSDDPDAGPQRNAAQGDRGGVLPKASAAPSPANELPERTDPKLLEILVCPLTKTRLSYDASAQELVSKAAGLAYPIRNGVPLMTAEAARQLDD